MSIVVFLGGLVPLRNHLRSLAAGAHLLVISLLIIADVPKLAYAADSPVNIRPWWLSIVLRT